MARQGVVDVQPGELMVGEAMGRGFEIVGIIETAGEDADLAAARPGEVERASTVCAEAALDLRRRSVHGGRAVRPLEIVSPEPVVGEEGCARDLLTHATVTVGDSADLALGAVAHLAAQAAAGYRPIFLSHGCLRASVKSLRA